MDIDEWLARLSAELGPTTSAWTTASVTTLLDLAREAAHGVERRRRPR